MARSTNRAVFNASLLPEAQPRWDLFSAGFGLQIAAVTALVVIPLLLPQKLDIVQRYWTTPVEAPPIVAWKPQPVQPREACSSETRSCEGNSEAETGTGGGTAETANLRAGGGHCTDRQEAGGAQGNCAGYDGSGEGVPGSDAADVHGQLGDSDIEEASRSRADGRIRRSQRRAGQR